MLYGLLGGLISRTALAGGFLSMVLMNAFGLLRSMLRYFVQLMGGRVLPARAASDGRRNARRVLLCFIVYLPMRRISRAFSVGRPRYKGAPTPWKK